MLPSPLVAPAVSAFSSDFTRLRIGVAECSEGPTEVAVCSFPQHTYAATTHISRGQSIQPFQTERDGYDLLAASTSEIFGADADLSDLRVLSSELVCAPVLKCVPRPFTEPENVQEGKS
jgi:hypothetical protein